jgi:hypothetical protein
MGDIDDAFDALITREYNALEVQWATLQRQVFERLLVTLRRKYGGAYNFEIVLSALHDILPFRHVPYGPEYAATITSVAALNGWDATAMLDVFEVVNQELLRLVERQSVPVPGDRLDHAAAFFAELVRRFRITHTDLNYDDFSDGVYPEGATDDGFRGHGWPKHFAPRELVRATAPVRLMHQHGSYRFRYHAPGGGFVKLETGGTRLMPGSVDTLDGYRYHAIISGTAKMLQLTPLPFPTYYQLFANATLTTPRLLVIGYGGGDLHLNTYLVQMKKLHGEALRVAWVYHGDIRAQRELMRSMCAVYAGERHQDPGLEFVENLTVDGDGFAAHDSLMLYSSGFPLRSPADGPRIIAHLEGG